MQEVALALESTRAAKCTSIDEECDIYGKTLDMIIEITKKGPMGVNDKLLIVKAISDLDNALVRGHDKLVEDWKKFEANKNAKK